MASPAPSPVASRSKSPTMMTSSSGSKRSNKPKSVRKATSGRPTTLTMVIDAITSMKDNKGSSAQAIKKFIMSKYPGIPENFLPSMLKRAFAAGLKSGALVRPKSSTVKGATGRFRVGKPKAAPKKAAPKKKVAKKSKTAKKSTVRKQAGKVKKAKSLKKKKTTTKKSSSKSTKKVAKKTKPKAAKSRPMKAKMVKSK